MLALYLGMIGVDFEFTDAPELTAELLALAERYQRAAQTSTRSAGPGEPGVDPGA